MVAEADLPSLLAALAHVGETPDLLGDGLFLDPAKHHEPQGGWTIEQQAHARSIALRRAGRAAPMPGGRRARKPTAESVRPIMSWMMATEASDDYVELLLEELGDPSADLRAPDVERAELAPRSCRSASPSSARGCRVCWRPTGCARPASTSWCSRRTPTSAARGWRTPTRGAGSTSPTTTTATRSPSATTGRSTSPPSAELHKYFRECVDEFGIRAHIRVRHRGRRRSSSTRTPRRGRCETVDADGTRDASRPTRSISAVGPAQPAAAARHRRAATLRRPGVPLGRVGPHRRPHRQAGRA